jgi:hypothetical protein
MIIVESGNHDVIVGRRRMVEYSGLFGRSGMIVLPRLNLLSIETLELNHQLTKTTRKTWKEGTMLLRRWNIKARQRDVNPPKQNEAP